MLIEGKYELTFKMSELTFGYRLQVFVDDQMINNMLFINVDINYYEFLIQSFYFSNISPERNKKWNESPEFYIGLFDIQNLKIVLECDGIYINEPEIIIAELQRKINRQIDIQCLCGL